MDFSNPSHPLHPANPISPLNPINLADGGPRGMNRVDDRVVWVVAALVIAMFAAVAYAAYKDLHPPR